MALTWQDKGQLHAVPLPHTHTPADVIGFDGEALAATTEYLPVANGTHFNGNGGSTATAGLIQTRCRQTRKLLRVIGGGATTIKVEWANIWTSNTPQAGDASCEIAGPQTVTSRMSVEYPAGNPRIVSGSATYAAGTAYALLDQVNYNSGTWVCIQAGTGQTPADGSAYWRRVRRYAIRWDGDDGSGTISFAPGDYKISRAVALAEPTQIGDCIAVLGAFDTGSSTGYLPYAGANGACKIAPFVDWVVDAAGGLPAVGSALPDTGVTTQTNGNTTTSGDTVASNWMKIPYATAITGDVPGGRCVALFGDSLMQGTGGDIRDGEPCGIFPRSIDGATWWRVAQGGNRAGCYVPGNAPWQMSVIARCDATITNLCMNDINANLTTAQVQAAVQRVWKMVAATGTKLFAGYPTPISSSTDSWATVANQGRFTNGGAVATTQNPADDATYLTSVYGLVSMWLSQDGGQMADPAGATVKVGQQGHPVRALFDWRALIADPQTSWKWNPGYTTDGAHPIAAIVPVQAAYLQPQLEAVYLARQRIGQPYPTYTPAGEPPVANMNRSLVDAVSTALTSGSVVTVVGVSPGRWYYGFRIPTGTLGTGTPPTQYARTYTVLAGADPAKMKVITSGTNTPNNNNQVQAPSGVWDVGLSGAPLWIPAGYLVAIVLTVPGAAAWAGHNAAAAIYHRSGIGFVLAGTSADTAALTGVINLFNTAKFTATQFRVSAEIY